MHIHMRKCSNPLPSKILSCEGYHTADKITTTSQINAVNRICEPALDSCMCDLMWAVSARMNAGACLVCVCLCRALLCMSL